MVSTSSALVRGRRARFTLTDQCGFPQITNSMYVTDGFISVTHQKNIDAGDEIKVRKADGTIGLYEPGQASLQNIPIEIKLIRVDPAVISMVTSAALVVDYSGKAVGWEEKALVPLSAWFAMELWTGNSSAACSAGSALNGYMLYPLIGQGYVQLDDVTDKEITATIHGQTYGNPSWGKGPYGGAGASVPGPVEASAGVAGRLLAVVDPTAHRHFEITPIAPPAAFTVPGPISITLPTTY